MMSAAEDFIVSPTGRTFLALVCTSSQSARSEEDAYGTRTVTTPGGTVLPKSTIGFQRGFTGYQLDEETGLYYARNRMYSSQMGRFIGRDRLGYVDGMSLYGGYFAPNGLDPLGDAVYFVARQFAGDDSEVSKNAKLFQAGLAHGYIMITDDTDGHVIGTYSWHPGQWPAAPTGIPWWQIQDIGNKLDEVMFIDANKARPGRIWKNDPTDMGCPPNGSRQKLKYKPIKISDDPDFQRRLMQYIDAWIAANGVGYEEGAGTPEKGNEHNDVSAAHRPPTGMATDYWLYGQNCFWWANTALSRVNGGPLPPDIQSQISGYDLGFGSSKWLTHNGMLQLTASATKNSLWNDVKGLFGSSSGTFGGAMSIHPGGPVTQGVWLGPGKFTDVNPLGK